MISGGGRDWDVYMDGMMIYYDLRCGATQCAKAAFGNKTATRSASYIKGRAWIKACHHDDTAINNS